MGRVTEQRHAAGTPAVDRVAVIHAGDEGRRHLLEHGARPRFGILE
jgi:hypothetical protein